MVLKMLVYRSIPTIVINVGLKTIYKNVYCVELNTIFMIEAHI